MGEASLGIKTRILIAWFLKPVLHSDSHPFVAEKLSLGARAKFPQGSCVRRKDEDRRVSACIIIFFELKFSKH